MKPEGRLREGNIRPRPRTGCAMCASRKRSVDQAGSGGKIRRDRLDALDRMFFSRSHTRENERLPDMKPVLKVCGFESIQVVLEIGCRIANKYILVARKGLATQSVEVSHFNT